MLKEFGLYNRRIKRWWNVGGAWVEKDQASRLDETSAGILHYLRFYGGKTVRVFKLEK